MSRKKRRTQKHSLAANATPTPALVSEAERAKPTIELGVGGLLQWNGIVAEAYLAELQYPQAYTKFNEMRRRDPTIASLLNAVKLLARTTILSTEPGGSSDVDKRAQEFLDQNLADMSITAEDAVEDALSAVPYGWAWAEIVYKRRLGPSAEVASKYDDGAIGWRKFAPRRQSSFNKWLFDESGGVQGLYQSTPNDMRATQRFVPINKSIHFTADRDMGNPEGMSILEPVYEPWHFVKNLQIINGIGFERSFVGLPVFTYGTPENPFNPTDADIALVGRMGKALRVDEKAFVAVPGEIGFKLETTSNTNASSLLETIKQYRIWMLMVVLADFIALGTISSGGSYALGQDKSELFLMGVDGWLDKLMTVWNRYAVKRLFAYNDFPGMTDYPQIVHSSIRKPNLPALASFIQSLTAYITPDTVLESSLRRMANLPEAQAPADGETEDLPATDDPETGDKADPDGDADEAAKLARARQRELGRLNYQIRAHERAFKDAQRQLSHALRAAP